MIENNYPLILVGTIVLHWAAMVSPGPNVALIIHTSLKLPRAHSLATALGIAVGGATWTLLALLGLRVLFLAFPLLANIAHIVGGVYLIYLGVKTYLSSTKSLSGASAGKNVSKTQRIMFFRGLITCLANPKALVFFGSIFAVSVPPYAPLGFKLGIVFVVFINSLIWHGVLAWLVSTTSTRRNYQRAKMYSDRISGVTIAGFGLSILISI